MIHKLLITYQKLIYMKSAPLVSLGLPVYNGSNFLEETLVSISEQTFADYELIISDNASTDST